MDSGEQSPHQWKPVLITEKTHKGQGTPFHGAEGAATSAGTAKFTQVGLAKTQ